MSTSWKFNSNTAAVRKAIRLGLVEGLEDAGEQLLAESRRRVPDDTGALQASGRVEVDRARLEVVVAYGTDSVTAEYASIVHERMDLRHDDGEPKFLEAALNSERTSLGQVVARATRRRT